MSVIVAAHSPCGHGAMVFALTAETGSHAIVFVPPSSAILNIPPTFAPVPVNCERSRASATRHVSPVAIVREISGGSGVQFAVASSPYDSR